MYSSREFGSGRKTLNSSVVVRGEGDEEKVNWVARVQLLCHLFCKVRYGRQGTGIYAMDGARTAWPVHDTIRSVCLPRATTDDGESDTAVGGSVKKNDCTLVSEWFGAKSFQSFLTTLHVAR